MWASPWPRAQITNNIYRIHSASRHSNCSVAVPVVLFVFLVEFFQSFLEDLLGEASNQGFVLLSDVFERLELLDWRMVMGSMEDLRGSWRRRLDWFRSRMGFLLIACAWVDDALGWRSCQCDAMHSVTTLQFLNLLLVFLPLLPQSPLTLFLHLLQPIHKLTLLLL